MIEAAKMVMSILAAPVAIVVLALAARMLPSVSADEYDGIFNSPEDETEQRRRWE